VDKLITAKKSDVQGRTLTPPFKKFIWHIVAL